MSNEILSAKIEGTTLIVEMSEGTKTFDSKFLVAGLLVFIARGSGKIEPEESARIITLIQEYYGIPGAESLELITTVMSELADNPVLAEPLVDLGITLPDGDKEDIALMGLKVVAADGHRHYSEMEQFNFAMGALGIAPEIVHRAFDRYFAETMPGE
ncbi:MAG: hypothetical protein GWP62_01730 [Gammaproteobacteria bacterium]|jgi:uncharacterized tellurite resistance protein B-like protein|nr:hypothetical protein [Gammaproteobacteria bacterium]